jgi:hypothetical protein
VGLAFLLIDAISIVKFLSSQIAIASGSDKYVLFSRLCKLNFIDKVKKSFITLISGVSFAIANSYSRWEIDEVRRPVTSTDIQIRRPVTSTDIYILLDGQQWTSMVHFFSS